MAIPSQTMAGVLPTRGLEEPTKQELPLTNGTDSSDRAAPVHPLSSGVAAIPVQAAGSAVRPRLQTRKMTVFWPRPAAVHLEVARGHGSSVRVFPRFS